MSPNLEDVVGQTGQVPLGLDLLKAPQEKRANPPGLLDLPEHGLNALHSLGVSLLASLCLKLPAHPVHYSHIFRDATLGRRLGWVAALEPLRATRGSE